MSDTIDSDAKWDQREMWSRWNIFSMILQEIIYLNPSLNVGRLEDRDDNQPEEIKLRKSLYKILKSRRKNTQK